ncbi:uncharacterized protein PY1_contig-01-43 [Novosphingobium sp. PY1]|nr:uncharacterized protein PY1_contig-01-43 [Novosphingobium sp. PY1]
MADSYVDGSVVPLMSVPGWEDANAQAAIIVEEFERLPKTYFVSISAPSGMDEFLRATEGQMRLANRARIVLADDEFVEHHPVTTGDDVRDRSIWEHSLLSLVSSPDNNYKWEGGYLQIIKQGYIGRFIETNTSHEVVGDFKALWGVQLALGIAKRRNSWSAYPVKRKLIVHQSTGDSLRLQMRLELDGATSSLVDQIAFNDWLPAGHPMETKVEVYKLYLNEIDLIFGESEEATRLRLASRWLFDSYATDNELLAYVQAMVCLEIILGDASLIGEIGLGELLRNRCAYLIGKTSTERAEILRDFKEIYDVRSHIVHRGKSRMNARERGLYAKLIWYCQRCIREEINLLKKTKEKSKED